MFKPYYITVNIADAMHLGYYFDVVKCSCSV